MAVGRAWRGMHISSSPSGTPWSTSSSRLLRSPGRRVAAGRRLTSACSVSWPCKHCTTTADKRLRRCVSCRRKASPFSAAAPAACSVLATSATNMRGHAARARSCSASALIKEAQAALSADGPARVRSAKQLFEGV